MIEYLIQILEERKLAVLSRGYKRISEGFVLGDSSSSVADLGDEPFQIHQKFPKIQVAVDGNRQNGIEQLMLLSQPDLILLDDAFQHRKVTPTFSILLTTYSNLYVEDWYLPTGDLRDSKREAERADIIVVTKCPTEVSPEERNRIEKKLKPKSHQEVLFSWFVYDDFAKDVSGEKIPWSYFEDKSIGVVTGIAMPRPFIEFLKSKNIQFEHLTFTDHHYFTENEVDRFNAYDLILTTEKDYVRLEGRVGALYYIQISHEFSAQDKDRLKNRLLDLN